MATFGLIFIILFSAMLISFVLLLLWQNIYSAPYVPSSRKQVQAAFKELSIGTHTRFVDLGSGDGSIVLLAAGMGADADGIEINPYLTLVSKLRAWMGGAKRAQFFHRSIYKHNLSHYNFVYLYLLPNMMKQLEPILFKELPKGSIIVSNVFKIPGREPSQIVNKHFLVYKVS